MKKSMKYFSLALNIMLVIALVYILISDEPELVDLSIHTQQDLTKAFQVRPSMTSEQVQKIMGNPIVKEFSKSEEEWHYCKTGHNVDEYIVIKLNSDKVTELQSYTVSWLDVVYRYTQTPTEATIEAGGMGDCRLTVRWGTYNKKTPNKESSALKK